jgi:hypothetical protein
MRKIAILKEKETVCVLLETDLLLSLMGVERLVELIPAVISKAAVEVVRTFPTERKDEKEHEREREEKRGDRKKRERENSSHRQLLREETKKKGKRNT